MNVTDFKATIGLDWADRQHDVWLRPAGAAKGERVRLEQTPEAVHSWAAELRARFPEGQVAVGIETSRGPVISALLSYDFIVIFPINPKAMKDYRGCFGQRGQE